MSTTKRIELIDKKEFAKAVLDKNVKAFVMHRISFSLSKKPKMTIHPAKKAQIALMLAKKVKNLTKYSDFLNVFLEKKALILPELTKLNKHFIKLQNSKQLLYRSIYSLGQVKLKILKTYIKTNLVNGFIWLSKLLAVASILFFQKLDDSLLLYVNYQGLNNLIIKT